VNNILSHTCDVVVVRLREHPNADSLSLVNVDDFQCVVRTSDWNDGDLGIYIPPDSVVPDTDEFKFLGGKRRIKARKLRGQWSMGLLIKAPLDATIGDDYMEKFGIVHYEPKVHGSFSSGGNDVTPPKVFAPVYDILNFRKYSNRFEDGEEVICTEKTHGCNSRFVCLNDQIFCGSRKFWKQEDVNNLWWKALEWNPALDAWLRHHEGLVVYGEVYGQVQNLKYGATNGELYFAAFDILDGDRWLDYDEARMVGSGLPWVPLVYRGPFDKEKILEFAEGDSSYPRANHHREGVVIKPVNERIDRNIGRVQLKVVGNRYLSKS